MVTAGLTALCPMRALALTGKLGLLIPGPPGSGWAQMARAISDALIEDGIVSANTFRHIADAGGRKAIAALTQDGARFNNFAMVHSTPMQLRQVIGWHDHGVNDLVPIAGLIEDSAVFATRKGAALKTMTLLRDAVRNRKLRVVGGSPPGGFDHVAALSIFDAFNIAPEIMEYAGGQGGGAALAALHAGEADILSTGLGEIAEEIRNDAVFILGVAEAERVAGFDALPTFAEQGGDITLRNWRGVYAPPGLTREERDALIALFATLESSATWSIIKESLGWRTRFVTDADYAEALEEHRGELKDLLRTIRFV